MLIVDDFLSIEDRAQLVRELGTLDPVATGVCAGGGDFQFEHQHGSLVAWRQYVRGTVMCDHTSAPTLLRLYQRLVTLGLPPLPYLQVRRNALGSVHERHADYFDEPALAMTATVNLAGSATLRTWTECSTSESQSADGACGLGACGHAPTVVRMRPGMLIFDWPQWLPHCVSDVEGERMAMVFTGARGRRALAHGRNRAA